MPSLFDIVSFCDQSTNIRSVTDFPGANNGLQMANNGTVTKVAAAVDAGLIPFQAAINEGVDFLIVHHGMFWSPIPAITGKYYQKLKLALDNNLALYSCHLPLDAHKEIGNNALLAKAIGLEIVDWFLPYEGNPVALMAKGPGSRKELKLRLDNEFNNKVTAIEYGSKKPDRIAILTGSGRSALPHLKAAGTDTLITGELRQEHFNLAQEEGLNLYVCGHYATETYGVKALAEKVAETFNIPSTFIQTGCPL